MATNYSSQTVSEMIELYTSNPNRETVEKLAEAYGKSVKSIIGKLSKEGVYQKSEYLTKTGEKPVTKSQLVQEICGILGVPEESLNGLEKAPKNTLKNMHTALILNLKPEDICEL